MSTKHQKTIEAFIAILMIGSFIASPVFSVPPSPPPRNATVQANVNELFTARFAFYRDTNPDPNDPDIGTEIQGEVPTLDFNIVWDGSLDWVTIGDSNRRVLMARNLGATAIFRALIGVINNTGRPYTISHEASALTSGGATLPDGSYTVTSFVDPGPEGFPNAQVGAGIDPTRAPGSRVLYTSDGTGTGTVAHIVYSISNGYDEGGNLRTGVDPNNLIGVNFKAGSYAGDLTLTVDLGS